MRIKTIKDLYNYLISNSGFSSKTIRSTINSLGYNISGTKQDFIELSGTLEDCSKHGADGGFSGFIYYDETKKFYKENRVDIISHMERTAAEFGSDIISMIKNFGVFRYSTKPTSSEIGIALWDSRQRDELTNLYNVFAWYALEEIAHTWHRYLEDNPSVVERLIA